MLASVTVARWIFDFNINRSKIVTSSAMPSSRLPRGSPRKGDGFCAVASASAQRAVVDEPRPADPHGQHQPCFSTNFLHVGQRLRVDDGYVIDLVLRVRLDAPANDLPDLP